MGTQPRDPRSDLRRHGDRDRRRRNAYRAIDNRHAQRTSREALGRVETVAVAAERALSSLNELRYGPDMDADGGRPDVA